MAVKKAKARIKNHKLLEEGGSLNWGRSELASP